MSEVCGARSGAASGRTPLSSQVPASRLRYSSTLPGMSTVVAGAATQETRTVGPAVRSAVALFAAGTAVFCLLSGLSYPGFPFSTAAWGVLAAAVAVALVVASGLRAVTARRGGARAAVMLALVALVLAGGVVAAKQDDGARLADQVPQAMNAALACIGND